MYEWNEAIQKMIDWVEAHLTENPSLLAMAEQIGYSPYYCSRQFHQIVGKTLKAYMAERRLAMAAAEIRDTQQRVLDVAVKYGFSSQQALTRAFVYTYGCTPAAYRKNPVPIPIFVKKAVLFPEYYEEEGERKMQETILTEAKVRVEYIPAHKYIALWDGEVQSYFAFWERHPCDEVCGLLESMSHAAHPVVGCHTGGWFWENGRRGYSYGMGAAEGDEGIVPKGFSVKEFPGSYYLVFYHPSFDFLRDCDEVVGRVETLAWSFKPETMGFLWNEKECQDYQRFAAETIGYEVLRPVIQM